MIGEEQDAPVLVVLVNNHSDWQRVREEGWYRIPLKHAPQPAAASWLAFYQSRAFGDDAFQIRYLAPVRRYRIVTRRELLPHDAGHPRANDRYYRIDVGDLQELERPIPSRRLRRITFIPTTMRRLRLAEEINDLWIGDDAEELLWELFRDAGIKAERRLAISEGRQRYIAAAAIPRGPTPASGGVAVFCDERQRPVQLGAWQCITLAPALLRSQPLTCISWIRDALIGA